MVSCMKETYDFNNLDLTDISPTVGVPILSSTIELNKVLLGVTENEWIEFDDSNLMHLVFRQDVTAVSLTDFLEIPSQDITQLASLEPLEIENFENVISIALVEVVDGMSEPEKSNIEALDGQTAPFPAFNESLNSINELPKQDDFDYVIFDDGEMTLTLANFWPVDIENFRVVLENIDDNSICAQFNYGTVHAGNTITKSVLMEGKRMASRVRAVIENVESPGTNNPVAVDLASAITLTFRGIDLKVRSGSMVYPQTEVLNDTIINPITFSDGEQLSLLRLKEGTFTWNIDYGLGEAADLTISIENATKNGQKFSQKIRTTVGAPTIGSQNLDGYSFTFDENHPNQIIASIVATTVYTGIPKPFDLSNSVNAEISIGDFQIDFLQGYLGSKSIEMIADPIDFAFDTDIIPGDLQFVSPVVELNFMNSFGVPFELRLDNMSVLNENLDTILFTGEIIDNPNTINHPEISNPYDSVATTVTLDSLTSNIVEIINAPPAKIIPDISVLMNPDGVTDQNFLTFDSRLSVGMTVDVPFHASLSNFSIKDTIEFNLGEEINLDLDAQFIATIENSFPIEAEIQLYFMNTVMDTIDSLLVGENSLAAGQLDLQGNVTGSNITNFTIDVPNYKLKNLTSASFILLDVKVQTPQEGKKAAKFYLDSKMDINLGIITGLVLFPNQ